MILLEYIIAQHQDGNVSVAISTKKVKLQNPSLIIKRLDGFIVWEFRGLQLGPVETITGQSRVTRIDIYIGMDDLTEQRNLFLTTAAMSLGHSQGLRTPVGSERVGGKQIRWSGAIGRVRIEDVEATIPPFKLKREPQKEIILNVDRETSPFPIRSEAGARTIRELHFGVEHQYNIRQNGTLKIPRLKLAMTEEQYATVLDYIDMSLASHP